MITRWLNKLLQDMKMERVAEKGGWHELAMSVWIGRWRLFCRAHPLGGLFFGGNKMSETIDRDR